MKIATWNLERGPSRKAQVAQRTVLEGLGADILVLTEPPTSYRSGPFVVTSPRQRDGRQGAESWVAIVGKSAVKPAEIDIPFERMAAAARATVDGREVIIYGAVLPWNSIRSHAPELVRAGESAFDDLRSGASGTGRRHRELRRRYRPDLIIWAGDFNQTVTGPNYGGSGAKRGKLVAALRRLGFRAWNQDEPHASPGLHAIDLICGPTALAPSNWGRIEPVHDGIVMSDHAGYWVEI